MHARASASQTAAGTVPSHLRRKTWVCLSRLITAHLIARTSLNRSQKKPFFHVILARESAQKHAASHGPVPDSEHVLRKPFILGDCAETTVCGFIAQTPACGFSAQTPVCGFKAQTHCGLCICVFNVQTPVCVFIAQTLIAQTPVCGCINFSTSRFLALATSRLLDFSKSENLCVTFPKT